MEEKSNLVAEVHQLDAMLQVLREEAKQERAVVASYTKVDGKKRKSTSYSSSSTPILDDKVTSGKVKNNGNRDGSSSLSTFSRTRNVTLSTKEKKTSIYDGQEPSKPFSNEVTTGLFEDDEYYYEEVEIVRSSDVVGTKFGTQKRFLTNNNVTSSAYFGSYFCEPKKDALSSKSQNNGAFTFSREKRFENESSTELKQSIITNGHADISFLSSRPRNPNTVFHSESNTRRKTSATDGDSVSILGPGYYSIDDTAIQKTSTHRPQGGRTSVGIVYRSSSVTSKRQAQSASGVTTTTAAADVLRSQLLGPGAYDVESCDRFVKPTAKTAVIYRSESKPTPQMEKRQYWEQKAADLRDFHDGMKLANDSFTQPKTPTFNMNPRQAFNDTESSKLTALKVSKSVDISGNHEYDVRYDFVEKRVATGVSMASEVTARSSTKKRLESKPGVVKALADKTAAEKGNDRLYGPQLPVAWVEDREVMRSWKSRRTSDDHDNDNDGGDSPTREVLQLLGDALVNAEDDLARAGTEAFLRSTFSGSLQKRPAPLSMKEVPQTKSRNIPESLSSAPFEYIGPQLQQDWLSDKASSSMAPRMDRTPGRETVKVHQKGLVEVIDFSDPNIRSNFDPEPTDYDVDRHFAIAALNNVKGLAFSKAISREDLLRRESDRIPLDLELSDDLFYEERLDIDYGRAKDQATGKKDGKGMELYTKDRYPTINGDADTAAPDHVGGTWFKGMYEEVASKAAVVKYDRMVGRHDHEDNLDDISGVEGDVTKEGAVLDLEVSNWKPSSARVPVAHFQDPIKYPRFPVEVNSTQVGSSAEVASDYFESHGKVFVNMDRMIGRSNTTKDTEETEMAAEEIEGKISDSMYAQVAAQKMKAVLRGQDLTSKHKNISEDNVNMSKQIGRPDLADGGDEQDVQLQPLETQHAQEALLPRLVWMTDWNKMSGRETSEDQMPLPAEFDTREELILDPVSTRSSKSRRVITGPKWEALSESRFPVDDSIDEMEGRLDIDYVDPGNFKKGMQPIGAGKVSNLGKQISRPVDNLLEEKLIEEEAGFHEPRLDLAPQHPEKKLMGVSNMSKALPRSVDAQHEENVMEREMKEYSAVSEKSSRRTQSSLPKAAAAASVPEAAAPAVKKTVLSDPAAPVSEKKPASTPAARIESVQDSTIEAKKDIDPSQKSGDPLGKRRVTFADDVQPANLSNPKNAKPVKSSSASIPSSAKDGARSGASSNTNKSLKPATVGYSTTSSKNSNSSQQPSHATSVAGSKPRSAGKKIPSVQREESTPPYISIPKVADRAPHTVMEGFHDNLSSNEMMNLVNEKLKALDL